MPAKKRTASEALAPTEMFDALNKTLNDVIDAEQLRAIIDPDGGLHPTTVRTYRSNLIRMCRDIYNSPFSLLSIPLFLNYETVSSYINDLPSAYLQKGMTGTISKLIRGLSYTPAKIVEKYNGLMSIGAIQQEALFHLAINGKMPMVGPVQTGNTF